MINKKTIFCVLLSTIALFGATAYAMQLQEQSKLQSKITSIANTQEKEQEIQKTIMRQRPKNEDSNITLNETELDSIIKIQVDKLQENNDNITNLEAKNNYNNTHNNNNLNNNEEDNNNNNGYYNIMNVLYQKHLVMAGYRGVPSSNAYNFNVTLPSYITAYELNQVLSNTGLSGLGESYIQAEMQTGVNAIFLCAVTALESSWGKSNLAELKNNIGGFGAYDSNPFDSAVTFNSKSSCIFAMANAIARDYINPNGSYYAGNSIAAINKYYSTSPNWKNSVWKIADSLQTDINNLGNN